MHKLRSNGLRIAGLVLMALVTAHCGDNNVTIVGSGGNIDPTAGTFFGTTNAGGGSVTIIIGNSVDSATLVCDGQSFGGACDPVLEVVNSTAIGTCSHLSLDVTFVSNAQARINDISAGTSCDGLGDAARGGEPSPTVTTTSTDGGTPTPTLTPTPTSDDTNGTPIETPTGSGDLPTPTTTATPNPCPEAVRVEGMAGSGKVLDSGWTGLGHNATVISDGVLTVSMTCSAQTRPCGVCTLGPTIENPGKDQGTIDNQRCSGDTSIKCTSSGDCGGFGPCSFYFGSPLPLTAGGVSTCVVNEITGGVSGTANVETGAFSSAIGLTSRVFTGIATDQPCPTCEGDGAANDGNAGGTCSGGLNDGGACDVNGSSPVPAFGNTSLDCSPGTSGNAIANLPIDLAGSSGSESLVVTENSSNPDLSSPDCEAVPFNPDLFPFISDGKCPCSFCKNNPSTPCQSTADCSSGTCGGGSGGESTKPNSCRDGVCSKVVGGKGQCATGPFDQNCELETFRGCLTNADCPAGDACDSSARPCFLDNGFIGGKIEAQGTAGAPVNGVSNSVFASTFCIAPTSASAVNAAAGLPGPGRIELPIEAREVVGGVVAGGP